MNDTVARLGLEWISALRQQEADFFADPHGPADGRRRSELVDRIVRELFLAAFGNSSPICLAAVGGYGRGELFPCSDIDLLALSAEPPDNVLRERLRVFLQSLWDANLRVSHGLRQPAECGILQPGNLEFTISLLDLRPLAGETALADSVLNLYLPRLIRRRRRQLQSHLRQLIAERHARYADTVYHLEPNVKESPGGLRDLQAVGWWRALSDTEDRLPPHAERWREAGEEARQAQDFLALLRTFLHYVQGRDINLLHYDLQDRLARELRPQHQAHTAEAWMRAYFRHARAISRRLRRTLYLRRGAFLGRRRWKLSGGWQVRDGELHCLNGASLALDELCAALLAAAENRLQLSPAAEQAIRAMLPELRRQAAAPGKAVTPNPQISPEAGSESRFEPEAAPELQGISAALPDLLEVTYKSQDLAKTAPDSQDSLPALPETGEHQRITGRSATTPIAWQALRPLLLSPFAYPVLSELHELGVLSAILPEFSAVEGWVQRDFHHRYTVDEHTLLTLRALNELASARSAPRLRLAELLGELEYPERLKLALLLHDLAKPFAADHIEAGARQAEAIAARWRLADDAADDVVFLVRHHLLMSQALRRDIFDPENIRSLAAAVGNEERLKMLALMTWADIHSVHPEAMTAWKEENLWQLYVETYNRLTHAADQNRIGWAARDAAETAAAVLERLPPARRPPPAELAAFLDGLPRRYLATHPPAEMAAHFSLAREHRASPGVLLRELDAGYELTVIMPDRPGIFVTLAGELAIHGANIVKAEAFANRAGLIVDRFRFTDPGRALALNPGELDRLRAALVEKLRHPPDRAHHQAPALKWFARRAGPEVAPRLHFEPTADGHHTLLEIVARDRPGLLFELSRILAAHACDIVLALIDTESTRAIDVFYLTHDRQPLRPELQAQLHAELLAVL